jgi:S-adenosylmethionine:tRNA ribosyltransferase-isomerase
MRRIAVELRSGFCAKRREMRVDLFDFELPEERIALRPASPRESARLLVVGREGALEDRIVADLPSLLRPGDALVVNDAKVIPARLHGVRARGSALARIEATLHKREGEDRWRAFARPAKKLAVGERVRFGEALDGADRLRGTLEATVAEKAEGGEVLFRFDRAGPSLDDAIMRVGQMPLPPYIAHKRKEDAADARDYQTIFAAELGAVAAPTAGLHFTPALAAACEAAGASLHRVTLNVGAGTFLPVKVDDTADHKMHSEWGRVTPSVAEALNAARAAGGRVVAVGTTSLRVLESAADEAGRVRPFAGDTSIFITPGAKLRAVDALMTNFHLPRSTLFMLVSAFSGLETMQAAYAHAVAAGYRFYSYGDACFLTR